MKSFRGTILALLIVAGLVSFAVYDNKSSGKKAELKEDEKNLARIKPIDITKFEIKTRVGSLIVEKSGKDWKVTSPIQDEGDDQAVDNFLESAATEKIIQVVAEGSDFDPKVYGLDEPLGSIQFFAADGRHQEIKIGKVKAYDSSLYAQIDNEPKALLVSSIFDVHLVKQAKEFRSKYAFRKKFAVTDITKFHIVKNGLAQDFTKDGDGWKVVKGNPDFPLDAQKVKDFFGQVEALRAQDLLPEPSTAKLKSSLEIELFSKDKKFVLRGEEVAPPQKTGEPYFKMMSSDVDSLLSVTLAAFNTVNRDAQDFYDKKLPFQFDAAKVTEVQFHKKGAAFKFDKKAGKWELKEGSLQKDADPSKLSEVVDKVAKLEAVRIFKPVTVGQKPAPLKEEQRLDFNDESGKTIFTLTWGKVEIEKGTHLEIRYIPARTSQSQNLLALPEASVQGLGLEKF